MVRYNAHHNRAIVLTAILCPLSLLAVALRLVARTKVKAGFGIDDVLAIATTISFFGFCSVFVLAVENGLTGYELNKLPLETVMTLLKANYAGSIFALTALFLADLSILMLYRRTFRTHKKLQIVVYIVGALCTAWWIGRVLGVDLRCLPVESQWNPLVSGKCYELQKINIAVGVMNSVLDIAIVTMPIGVIKDLHLSPKQKITLCFIFLEYTATLLKLLPIRVVFRHSCVCVVKVHSNKAGLWAIQTTLFW